jgi:hypothetical protein
VTDRIRQQRQASGQAPEFGINCLIGVRAGRKVFFHMSRPRPRVARCVLRVRRRGGHGTETETHLLAAISMRAADEVIFFGDTALSRTIAPDGRLSEDIDLIARGRRRDTAG